ncbi:MAG: hypothetical protein ABR609_03110 [Acidimicrobiia bacterium]
MLEIKVAEKGVGNGKVVAGSGASGDGLDQRLLGTGEIAIQLPRLRGASKGRESGTKIKQLLQTRGGLLVLTQLNLGVNQNDQRVGVERVRRAHSRRQLGLLPLGPIDLLDSRHNSLAVVPREGQWHVGEVQPSTAATASGLSGEYAGMRATVEVVVVAGTLVVGAAAGEHCRQPVAGR